MERPGLEHPPEGDRVTGGSVEHDSYNGRLFARPVSVKSSPVFAVRYKGLAHAWVMFSGLLCWERLFI